MRQRAVSLAFALAVAGLAAAAPCRGAERLPPGASSCSGCHAAPRTEGAPPPLNTLSAEEIATALAAFRSGSRAGTVMGRIARGFSDAESRAIAAALARPAGSHP